MLFYAAPFGALNGCTNSKRSMCTNRDGFSSVGRALVSKTRCREFEPLNPCKEN
nr:hypothetical protein [uncultured bacterium]